MFGVKILADMGQVESPGIHKREAVSEFLFLLDCLKHFLKVEPRDSFERVNPSTLELSTFKRITRNHSLLPIVYTVISRVAESSRKAEWVTLKESLAPLYQRMLQRNMRLCAETVHLIQAFQAEGIRALPLKGTTLSLQLYGGIGYRQAGDIDLLVEPAMADRAIAVMQDINYEWQEAKPWNNSQKQLYIRQNGEISLSSREPKISVDLHFRWSRNKYLFGLPFEQAWEASTPLMVTPSASLNVLSLEHQLLYLTAHGAKHKWSRLLWLLDVAVLIQKIQTLNLNDLGTLVHDEQLQRPLGQACRLMNHLLAMDIPGEFQPLCNARFVPWLTTIATQQLQASAPPPSTPGAERPPLAVSSVVQSQRYEMRLKPQLAYKISSWKRLVITSKDWEILTLPESLWFLYVILRPVFYLWRIVKIAFPGQ